MKRQLILSLLSIISIMAVTNTASGFNVNFNGGDSTPVCVIPPKSSGLSYVYVVKDMSKITSLDVSGVDVSSISGVSVYSNMGGGYAQDIAYVIENGRIVINKPNGDLGYVIQSSAGSECFWIVDYANKRFNVKSIEINDNQQCDYSEFNFSGYADAIKYYSIAGQPLNLDRGIMVRYNTINWDEDQNLFKEIVETKVFGQIGHTFTITPPLYSNTSLIMVGDEFLKSWGEEVMYESALFTPNGICVHTRAVQTNADTDEASNQIKNEGSGLGGSAPADFVFSAYTSEEVIHNEWQISEDPNFENIKYRFTDKELNYTFYDEGKYYVRFVGSNSDGSCEAYGEDYTIGIGSSNLRIPNAFSPDGDGVNDVWKVGYSSLLDFKCWIFDRNGQQLFYFDNPQLGWDGKYKGKTVPAGVYYYVIEARGADGIKYKKGGDINILNYKKIPNYTE